MAKNNEQTREQIAAEAVAAYKAQEAARRAQIARQTWATHGEEIKAKLKAGADARRKARDELRKVTDVSAQVAAALVAQKFLKAGEEFYIEARGKKVTLRTKG